MKATLTLLICLALSQCFAPSIRAGPSSDAPADEAFRLLKLSQKQNLRNHRLAIQTAQQALTLYQSVNNAEGAAEAYEHLGQFYFAQNALTESAHYYELALGIWRQQSILKKQAEVLVNFGFIEARKGEWLNGFIYITQAQTLIDEQNDPRQMGRIAAGMAELFNESGLPESGRAQYQRAIEYFRLANRDRTVNRMIMLMGRTDFLLKDYPAALTNLQQALASFENWPQPAEVELDIAECHEYLGEVYIAMGQYELALQHLQPILPVYKSSFNAKEAAQVEALIGQIYQQQGSISRARRSYLEASRVFREISDRVNDASVRFALGRLELNNSNYEAAEKYLKESIEDTEDIRHDLASRVFAAAFSASVHERYEAYIECLMRKHKLHRSKGLDVLAFEASELARARSLSELLRDTRTTAFVGVDPQLAQKERSLRHAIRTTVDQTISLATNYKKEQFDKLEDSLTSLRQQHQQIIAKLREANPDYDKIKEPASYSLQQIQNLVINDDQTVLLEYLIGQNASYVWAIRRNSVEAFELPPADVINEAVRRVYKNVSKEPEGKSDDELNKATAELANMILSPVAAQLTAPRVIVVADGALNYIPFQLLPVNNEPLVAKYEVINAPSAWILGQLRQEQQSRPPRSKVLAAFGDPVFESNYAHVKSSTASELTAQVRASRDVDVDADLLDPSTIQPLNYTKFELNNLSEIAGSGAFVARNFTASRETLSSIDLSKYAILHFATHGVFNPEKPEDSGFYLSMVDTSGQRQDGFINMQDVYKLDAPVDLVVLSACRTGLGQAVRGEGLIGLTRGFMHAGASSVVASLWKVDDEATSKLMKYFYVNMLQKGMPPAEALRAAQNTLRQDPNWQSPHFWAAFTLQGEFKQTIQVPPSRGTSPLVQKTVVAGLLMALLAGISWVLWRRRGLATKKHEFTKP